MAYHAFKNSDSIFGLIRFDTVNHNHTTGQPRRTWQIDLYVYLKRLKKQHGIVRGWKAWTKPLPSSGTDQTCPNNVNLIGLSSHSHELGLTPWKAHVQQLGFIQKAVSTYVRNESQVYILCQGVQFVRKVNTYTRILINGRINEL